MRKSLRNVASTLLGTDERAAGGSVNFRGVSLGKLANLVQETRTGRSKATLKELGELVGGKTEGSVPFVETLKGKEAGKPFQGAYVVCPRGSDAEALVDALEQHFQGQDVFIWLDVLSVNEAKFWELGQDARNKFVKETLPKAISKFQQHLVFFDGLESPTCLTRPWCVWEMSAMKDNITVIVNDPKQVVGTLLRSGNPAPQVVGNLLQHKGQEAIGELLTTSLILAVNEALVGGFNRLVRSSVDSANPKDKALLWYAGLFMQQSTELKVALQYLDHAKTMYEKEKDEKNLGRILNDIALVYARMKQFDDAIQSSEKALKMNENVYGNRSPVVCKTLSNIAVFYRYQNKLDQSIQHYRKVIERCREKGIVADAYCNIAEVLLEQGCPEEALKEYEQAIRNIKDGELRAEVLLRMAPMEVSLGHLDQAKEHYDDALSLFVQRFPDKQHVQVADCLMGLGVVCGAQKNFDDALDNYQAALGIYQKTTNKNAPIRADVLNNIGQVLSKQGKIDSAIDSFRQAADIFQSNPDTGTRLATVLCNMGQMFQLKDDHPEAIHAFEQALALQKAHLPAAHPTIADTLFKLSVSYTALGDISKAMSCAKESLAISQAKLGPSHPVNQFSLDQIDLSNVLNQSDLLGIDN